MVKGPLAVCAPSSKMTQPDYGQKGNGAVKTSFLQTQRVKAVAWKCIGVTMQTGETFNNYI